MAETASLKEIPQMPNDNFLGVLGQFIKSPLGLFKNAEIAARKAEAPLVKMRIAHKYGYYIADLEALRIIFREWDTFHKETGTDAGKVIGYGLVLANGEEWAQARKIMGPAFHRKAVASYVDIMRTLTEQMVAKLLAAKEPIAMNPEFLDLATSIVRDALFGAGYNNEEMARGIESTYYLVSVLVSRSQNPLSLPLSWPTPQGNKVRRTQKQLLNLFWPIVQKIRTQQEPGTSLLDLIINGEDTQGQGLNDQQILDQIKIIFLAGTETSAKTMGWAFYVLKKYPEVEAKLRQEIDQVLGDSPITFDHIPQLTYLRQVILETLRYYPPTWLTTRVALIDEEIMGFRIPEGASLMISPYWYHHNAEYWGDPENFRPERFAELDPLPHYFIPFMSGPRKCIGDTFALTELMVVFATLLQRTSWELAPDFQPNIKIGVSIGMKEKMEARFQLN
ncbi:MAG: cytochrome P450 [Bacteroidota bacterium]